MCSRLAWFYRSNQTLKDVLWLSSFAETIADYPATYSMFILDDSIPQDGKICRNSVLF